MTRLCALSGAAKFAVCKGRFATDACLFAIGKIIFSELQILRANCMLPPAAACQMQSHASLNACGLFARLFC
jgi:hypothetical protein